MSHCLPLHIPTFQNYGSRQVQVSWKNIIFLRDWSVIWILEIYQAKLWLSLFSYKVIFPPLNCSKWSLSQSTTTNPLLLQTKPWTNGQALIQKSSTLDPCHLVVTIGGEEVAIVRKALWASWRRVHLMKDSHISQLIDRSISRLLHTFMQCITRSDLRIGKITI